MKTVYAIHPETSVYVGQIELGQSDLSPLEDDVYLIPGGATELKPPEGNGQFLAVWVGSAWELQEVTPEITPPDGIVNGVPQSVTMRQARLALLGAGLLSGVDAAIAAMPEPDKSAAQITWEFAATVDRGFGMVPQLAAALGMTETQIDDLFIAAAQL